MPLYGNGREKKEKKRKTKNQSRPNIQCNEGEEEAKITNNKCR